MAKAAEAARRMSLYILTGKYLGLKQHVFKECGWCERTTSGRERETVSDYIKNDKVYELNASTKRAQR